MQQALGAGHDVMAYARNTAKLTIDKPRLAVVPGELTDTTTLSDAVAGADAVLSVLGPGGIRLARGNFARFMLDQAVDPALVPAGPAGPAISDARRRIIAAAAADRHRGGRP